jgi:acetyltransferase-like isoleucine patch superfamily enzyme
LGLAGFGVVQADGVALGTELRASVRLAAATDESLDGEIVAPVAPVVVSGVELSDGDGDGDGDGDSLAETLGDTVGLGVWLGAGVTELDGVAEPAGFADLHFPDLAFPPDEPPRPAED